MSRKRRRRKPEVRSQKSDGFTLLEIMIAILIFVMSVTALFSLFAVGSSSHRRGVEQTESAFLAERIFFRLQQDLDETRPRNITGAKLEDVDALCTFDAEFLPLDPRDTARTAFVVKVKLHWGTGSAAREESFETVLLRRPKP